MFFWNFLISKIFFYLKNIFFFENSRGIFFISEWMKIEKKNYFFSTITVFLNIFSHSSDFYRLRMSKKRCVPFTKPLVRRKESASPSRRECANGSELEALQAIWPFRRGLHWFWLKSFKMIFKTWIEKYGFKKLFKKIFFKFPAIRPMWKTENSSIYSKNFTVPELFFPKMRKW